MPVRLLWGEDDFRLEKSLINLRNEVLGSERSMLNYRFLDEPKPSEVLEAMQTTGMMFGNLLIEIRSKTLFLRSENRPSSSDETIVKIAEAIEFLPDNITVAFLCPISKGSNKKIDGTFKLVKVIKKYGRIIEFQPFKSYQKKELSDWIKIAAKEKGVNINNDAALNLIESVGEDLRRLDNELNKLQLLVYPKTAITKEAVLSLGISHDNIFTFADAWLSKDKKKAYNELNKLLEKESPLKVIAMLNTTVKKWLKLKIASEDLSYEDIGKNFNMHPYRVQKELEKLSIVSVDDIAQMQRKITKAEFSIKSGDMEAKLAMELML